MRQGIWRERLLDKCLSRIQDRRWHDIEWLTDPILHVLPEVDEVPVALVGIAAMYSLKEETDVQTQAGTVLFYYQDGAWQSNGKVLLNLTPSEALHQLSLQLLHLPRHPVWSYLSRS